MITHIVLLDPKAETSDEQLHAALEHVEALQKMIPGLLSVSTGKNASQYHQGYTYGIIMHFLNEASLEAHHPHPAHVAVIEELERLCERMIDFDLVEIVK
jgi:quinol monooxygenase YgiN